MESKAEALEALYESLVGAVRDELAAQPPPRRFLSKTALADHYGVSERTIRTWRARGMPGRKVGQAVMYALEETDKWIDGEGRG